MTRWPTHDARSFAWPLVLPVLTALAAGLLVPTASAQSLVVPSTDGPHQVYERSEALVIGEADYRSWDHLSAVSHEVDDVAQALRAQGFKVELRRNLGYAELSDALRSFLFKDVPRKSRLLVYFAGHGWTDSLAGGYVVPIDAPPDGNARLRQSLVSMQEVLNWSYSSHAKHILFVFDSCFSGAVFLTRSGLLPSRLFLEDADRPVRQVITSGNETDSVPALSDFEPRFVQGISGAADIYKDGIVTADELGYWLKSVITPLGKQTPQFGSSPVVNWKGGDTLFAYAPGPAIAPIPTRSSGLGTRGRAIARLGAPANPAANVFEGLEVAYYQKAADQRKVVDALDAASIPYTRTRGPLSDTFPISGIACGPDTPPEAVRRLASTLITNGIPIRAVFTFRDPKAKRGRMEIIALSDVADPHKPFSGLPLTLNQVSRLQACPTYLHN